MSFKDLLKFTSKKTDKGGSTLEAPMSDDYCSRLKVAALSCLKNMPDHRQQTQVLWHLLEEIPKLTDRVIELEKKVKGKASDKRPRT